MQHHEGGVGVGVTVGIAFPRGVKLVLREVEVQLEVLADAGLRSKAVFLAEVQRTVVIDCWLDRPHPHSL